MEMEDCSYIFSEVKHKEEQLTALKTVYEGRA